MGGGGYSYEAATHPHAVTTAGATTYAYDANGKLPAGGGRTLTYDRANRPASIICGGATATLLDWLLAHPKP